MLEDCAEVSWAFESVPYMYNPTAVATGDFGISIVALTVALGSEG